MDSKMLNNLFKSKENTSKNLSMDIKELSGKTKGLLAGYCTETGNEVYLYYSQLVQHVAVCGSTGTGISILRNSLLNQQMSNGGGLLFIDGGLSDKELETVYQSVCSTGRKNDFILIDPTDPENSESYKPELNFEELILQNKIIYVKLPIFNDPENAVALAKFIVGECRSAIAQLQRLPVEALPNPPFMFWPNECSSYIDFSWCRMFEQGRSSRFIMIPTYQTIKSLEHDGDAGLSDIVAGNTYYKFYFKQLTTEAAIQVANEIGMKSGSGSEKTYVVDPEQIKSIPLGECLLVVGMEQIYRLRLPLTDPAAQSE